MPGTEDGKELGYEAEEENLQRLREAERLENEDKPKTSSSSSSSGPTPELDRTRSTKSKAQRGEKPAEPAKLWDRPHMGEPSQPPNWSAST